MASIHFKVCKGSAILLKLVKFDVILLTQIQRLNNSLSCNPFEGLLPHAVGRDPKRLTSYLSFYLFFVKLLLYKRMNMEKFCLSAIISGLV